MIDHEPLFAATLPPAQLRRVEIAAKAMCRHRDLDDECWHDGEGRDECTCDHLGGGSCVAFGLYGDIALAVIEALDREAGK